MDKYLKIYRFPKNHQFANPTFLQEFDKHDEHGPEAVEFIEDLPAKMIEEEGPADPPGIEES